MAYQSFRFHVLWRHESEAEFRDFFQTDDLQEAKAFAMRLAYDETNLVCVRDEKLGDVVRDFDAEIHKR